MVAFTRYDECTTCCEVCLFQELVFIAVIRAVEGDPESEDGLLIDDALAIQEDDNTAKGDLVCHGCICTMFTNAIKDESNYPPQWAGSELSVATFRPILGGLLATGYKMKIVEYKTKWDDRVYCTSRGVTGVVCGNFIGEKTAHPLRKYCFECGTAVCMCCKDHIVPLVPHKCDGNALADEKNFKGLTKGKEWQKCPRCHNKFELWDGCNHIVCAVCKESLCFICGAPAAANSNHWSRSGGSRCPRYNQPGAANAMYEEDVIALAFPELFQDIPRPPGHIPNRGAIHAERLRRERLADIEGRERLTAQEFLTAMPAPPPRRAIEQTPGGDTTAQPPAPDRVRRQRVTGPVHIDVQNDDINGAARTVNPLQPRRNRVFNLLTNRTARENATPNPHANMPLPPRHRQASQPQPVVQTQRFHAHPAVRLANRTQQQTQRGRANAISNVAVVNQPLNGPVHGHHHRGQHDPVVQAQTQQEHIHAHHRGRHPLLVQQQAQEGRTHAHHRGRHPQLTEPQRQAENEQTHAQPEDAPQPLTRNPSLDFTFRFPFSLPNYSQNRHFTIIGAGADTTLPPNPLNTPPPPRGNLMAVNQTIRFRHPDLTGA